MRSGEGCAKRNAPPLQMSADECQHLLDRKIHLELGQLGSGFLGESPKSADHFSGVTRVAHDMASGIHTLPLVTTVARG
jgi:hypothetical protein